MHSTVIVVYNHCSHYVTWIFRKITQLCCRCIMIRAHIVIISFTKAQDSPYVQSSSILNPAMFGHWSPDPGTHPVPWVHSTAGRVSWHPPCRNLAGRQGSWGNYSWWIAAPFRSQLDHQTIKGIIKPSIRIINLNHFWPWLTVQVS